MLSRCRGEKASPSLRKADTGTFASLEAWWGWHFLLLSMETPSTYYKMSLDGPVPGQGSFYIKGALNIFFLKELCEFYVYWQAFQNVFNLVIFTNDLFTSYLLK